MKQNSWGNASKNQYPPQNFSKLWGFFRYILGKLLNGFYYLFIGGINSLTERRYKTGHNGIIQLFNGLVQVFTELKYSYLANTSQNGAFLIGTNTVYPIKKSYPTPQKEIFGTKNANDIVHT